MGKRTSEKVEEDGNQAYLKRQKISHVVSSAEDVQSSRQLKQLLAFDQDAGRAKHGIGHNPGSNHR
jgi:nucleolar pre-ribosomal-associated protein 1